RVLSQSAARWIRCGVRRANLRGRPQRTRRYTRYLLTAVADAVDELFDPEIVLLLAEEHLVPDDAVADRRPERLRRLLGLDDAVVVDAVGRQGVPLAQDQRTVRLLVVAVGDRRGEELDDDLADGPADRRRPGRGPAVFRMLGDQPALLVAEVPEGGVPLIADGQLRDDVVVAGPELVLEVVHCAAVGKVNEEAARILRGVAELLVVAVVDRAVEPRVAGGTGLGSRLVAAGRRGVPVRPALFRTRGRRRVLGVVAGVCSLELTRPLEAYARVPAGGVVAAEVVVELGGDVPLAAVAER